MAAMALHRAMPRPSLAPLPLRGPTPPLRHAVPTASGSGQHQPPLRRPLHAESALHGKGAAKTAGGVRAERGLGSGVRRCLASTASAVAAAVALSKAGPARRRSVGKRGGRTAAVAAATEDAPSSPSTAGNPTDDEAPPVAPGSAADGGAAPALGDAGGKAAEEPGGAALAAGEASEDAAAAGGKAPDPARVALVAQRLATAEQALRRWGYVAEVVYTWLGAVSLGIASFAAFSHGSRVYRSPVMALGPVSVGLSLLCSFVGWFQARGCRSAGRRCSLAASSLEPGAPMPPADQLQTIMPALGDVESGLRVRQRTAWLGVLFAVVGMQSMVGLLVAKVLAASGGLSPPPGVSLDVFTLLAVSNVALSHVIGGGAAAMQQGALPPPAASAGDPFRGWGRQ